MGRRKRSYVPKVKGETPWLLNDVAVSMLYHIRGIGRDEARRRTKQRQTSLRDEGAELLKYRLLRVLTTPRELRQDRANLRKVPPSRYCLQRLRH
jgi:hypothetical protein